MHTPTARRALHVLVLPSFYPTAHGPYSGTFFQDWACALHRVGVTTGVAYVEGRGLRTLSLQALSETRFQITTGIEAGLPTVRLAGWNPLAQWTPGGWLWARLAQRVISTYMERHGRPDIIAAQCALWAGAAAVKAKATWGLPYVITEVHTGFGTGTVSGAPAAIARKAFAHAEAVVAISENLRARLTELRAARSVPLIPCTVDDSYWSLPSQPRTTAPFTFYGQAHLTPRKGFDLLIRAFARSFRGDPGVLLVIGGGGPIRNDLEALAISSGVQSQVTFLGALPRDAVREAMWRANCFVLPSHAENFGVVLIEALSTGLPIISTRCGGPEDIINDAVGILLEPGDEDGLATALLTMRRRPVMGAQAIRAYVVRRYGYEAVGAQLRDLYCKVLGGNSTA